MQQSKSPTRDSRWLHKTVAAGVGVALIITGIASGSLSASATETPAAPAWNSPWLAGSPVVSTGWVYANPVLLANGTFVDADYNAWASSTSPTTGGATPGGAVLDIQAAGNGNRLFALTEHGTVITSTDSGDDWTTAFNPDPNEYPTGVSDLAASADGKTLVGAGPRGLYVSTDGGNSWPAATGLPSGYTWSFASVSSDGGTIVAVGKSADGSDSGVWVLANGTGPWAKTQIQSDIPNVTSTVWSTPVVSADGSVISLFTATRNIEQGTSTGTIEISTDRGLTWRSQPTPTNLPFTGMAMSGDGQKIVITRGEALRRSEITPNDNVTASNESTFTSQDSGNTWAEVIADGNGMPVGYAGVAVPASGIAPSHEGETYSGVSSDFYGEHGGVRWFKTGYNPAVSSDGSVIWDRAHDNWGVGTGPDTFVRYTLTRVQATHVEAVAPAIKSITPDRGPTSGGQKITVIGTGFDSCSVVSFNSRLQDTTFVDASHLTFVTPETLDYAEVAPVYVRDCTGNWTNGVDYTYVPTVTPPVVTSPKIQPPVVTPPKALPPLLVGDPGMKPVRKPFEAQTSAETEPNPASGLSGLAILAGLGMLGAVFARRRKGAVS